MCVCGLRGERAAGGRERMNNAKESVSVCVGLLCETQTDFFFLCFETMEEKKVC